MHADAPYLTNAVMLDLTKTQHGLDICFLLASGLVPKARFAAWEMRPTGAVEW